MTKKILVFTEMAFQGSGYYYLMSTILHELGKEYDIKVIGLGYNGEEHWYNFSIISCKAVSDAVAMATNLFHLWKPDIFICGMDIPIQLSMFEHLKKTPMKYIAITPMENGPLTMTWAAGLMSMDYVFFISELAKIEAQKAGLSKCDHLQVAVDVEKYKVPTPEEHMAIREGLGISPDTFMVLTVADNQERKNLWGALSAIAEAKKEFPNLKIKYHLVTREHSPVGHRLRDLALSLGINKDLVIHERGVLREDLWKLYAAADAFLLTSKAEGLGLPVLEAMSCGLPVVATKTGALSELLENGRGYLIHPEYEFIDVWGNSRRSMIDVKVAGGILGLIGEDEEELEIPDVRRAARAYVESRSIDVPVSALKQKIEEITNG